MSLYSKKIQKKTAPINGSFPLDHEGVCKEAMVAYMLCVSRHNQQNEPCRTDAKAYFECRMAENLMAREDWDKLGYGDCKGKKGDN